MSPPLEEIDNDDDDDDCLPPPSSAHYQRTAAGSGNFRQIMKNTPSPHPDFGTFGSNPQRRRQQQSFPSSISSDENPHHEGEEEMTKRRPQQQTLGTTKKKKYTINVAKRRRNCEPMKIEKPTSNTSPSTYNYSAGKDLNMDRPTIPTRKGKKRTIDHVENTSIPCTYNNNKKPCIPLQQNSSSISINHHQNVSSSPTNTVTNENGTWFMKAKQLKRQAEGVIDIHGRIKTYLQSGACWIKYGLLSEDKDKASCWESFAKFFYQTYNVSKLSKNPDLPEKIIFLASICLDCSGILFGEVVKLKREIMQKRAVELKKFFQNLPSDETDCESRPPGATRGSNPEDSFLEKVREKAPEIEEFIELSDYSVKSLAHLREARDLRKRLIVKNLHALNMPRLLELTPQNLPDYIDTMINKGEDFFS